MSDKKELTRSEFLNKLADIFDIVADKVASVDNLDDAKNMAGDYVAFSGTAELAIQIIASSGDKEQRAASCEAVKAAIRRVANNPELTPDEVANSGTPTITVGKGDA